MSTETYLSGIKSNVERNIADDLSILWSDDANVQNWNALTTDEIQKLVEETFELLNDAIDKNLLETLPFNYLKSINSNLNNFNSQFQTVKGLAPNQLRNQHHNPLNQINSVNSNIRNSGLFALLRLSPDIPENNRLIQEQLENINERKSEIDKLAKQVRTLMSPAVADRLSTAFSKRKSEIFKQKIGWLILVLVSIIVAMYYTANVSELIADMINPSEKTENIIESNTIGIIWVLRLLILFPIYFVVFFAIKQYSKERKLEEIYAHKSAIAETLPSYPELLTEKSVGDKITTDAATVIFSPAEKDIEKKSSSKNYKIEDIKELLDVASRMTKGAE
ncbi:hypothetical protein MED134_01645 [Dokdonia sp. MED134]|uniref:hypothetical protein n=1 Tax=Dokdonia sp. MED134 TaxID=313590 RepID=UPI0000689E86|nr:hypothetical protein [Dokdonia sp. MED134]EAQ39282.1 hypothetical protein MED134_01645 [Dokdonia sp. MED134]